MKNDRNLSEAVMRLDALRLVLMIALLTAQVVANAASCRASVRSSREAVKAARDIDRLIEVKFNEGEENAGNAHVVPGTDNRY